MDRAELARLLGKGGAAPGSRRVVIVESDPRRFMGALAQAIAGDAEIFLGDPDWGALERTQVDALLESGAGNSNSKTGRGFLMIPTGGSSGRRRFARHDAGTIAAAVHGFVRHFGMAKVNSAGVLPMHHVSGLMAWLRSALTGGEFVPLDWKMIQGGVPPVMPAKAEGWTVSLVPTQLKRLLRSESAVEWLRSFRIIFVGGGPAWPELLDQAAALRLPLSLGYGMTESAAMITALRPKEFLAGARSCGTVLPHGLVQIGAEGVVTLGGGSLFRGYYPHWREEGSFETEDCGWQDDRGHLHISGRRDAVIITGGEKVFPAEVEAVLRGSGELPEVAVLGLPDAEWGQVVVVVYPSGTRFDRAKVDEVVGRLLAPAKRPKRYLALENWPVNSLGKINRAELARLAELALRS